MDDKLYKKVLSIEAEAHVMKATAERLIENCYSIKKELRPVSTGSNKKTAVTASETAKVIARRRKNILRKVI